jgi:hypothetical protein
MIERAAEIEWLTSRPKPDGYYGMSAFMKSVDTKLLGVWFNCTIVFRHAPDERSR